MGTPARGARKRRPVVGAVVAAIMASAAMALAPAASGQSHDMGLLPPGDWTDEQEAFLLDLIERTEAELPAFGDASTLESLGFFDFGVTAPGGYDHWINLEWIDDEHVIDPQHPESLVFKWQPDGSYELVAAMFFLPSGHDLSNIPDELAWLPGWHTHPELCVTPEGRFAGLVSSDGTCFSGAPSEMPPMMHVWLVDPGCGHRFGGVGVGGLDCDVSHVHPDPTDPGPEEPPHVDPHPLPTDPGHEEPPGMDPGHEDPPPARDPAPPATPVRARPTYTG